MRSRHSGSHAATGVENGGTGAGSQRRRRILLAVTLDYQLRYHCGLERFLDDRGWEVHIVSSGGSALRRLAEDGRTVTHAIQMRRKPSLLDDSRALWQWLRLVRSVKPDVLLVGTPKASLLGLAAATACRVPRRIYEMHGLPLESARGVQRAFLTVVEWVTCRFSTEVVPVGFSLRAAAVRARVVKPMKAHVIGYGSPGGVSLRRFSIVREDSSLGARLRASLGLESGLPVVIFIGRLTAEKGLFELADAARHMRNPDELQLIIVGPTDDTSGEEALKRLKRGFPRTIAAGDVENVAEYLAVADALVLPSRREGLPTAVLEAFAAGVPVVGTNATGIIDLVVDGMTGFLVPVGDAYALGRALDDVLQHQDEALRRAMNARTLVSERFDQNEVHERWADYIDECS